MKRKTPAGRGLHNTGESDGQKELKANYNIIPFRKRLSTCRTCLGIYRPPPAVNCPDCRYWHGQVMEHQRYVAAMRKVRA